MKKIKRVLIRPIITEKSIKLVNELNKYSFIVDMQSNKIEVRKAVESIFDVKVLDVKVMNILGKKVTFGKNRTPGRKRTYKKAILTLKKGDKISVFEIK